MRRLLVDCLTKALGALSLVKGGGTMTSLTGAHLEALPRFLSMMPVADLVALASGAGNLDNAFAVAEAGASIVASAFPPTAITAGEVKLGLEALQFLLDVAGLGPSPFKITPGYRPLTGGFAGARGHI